MAEHLSAVSGKVWLFYLKHSQSCRDRLSFNVIREICTYFAHFELVHVTDAFPD